MLQRIRAANFRQLVSTLEQIKREHGEWISRRIADETKALSVEKATFHALKARAAAEARDTAAFAKLRFVSVVVCNRAYVLSPSGCRSFDTQGAVVAQDLSEHAPDYRLLQSLFKSAHSARVVELSAKKSKSVTLVRLLKSFKVFERFLEV